MQLLSNLCCINTDACKCSFLNLTRNQNIKFTYISLILLTILTTGVISKTISQQSSLIQKLGCENSTQISQCSTQMLTFKWLFCLGAMHFLIGVVLIFRNQVSKIVNQGLWFGKILFIISFGFVFMYFMQSELIQKATAYLVPIWFLLQSILIIDLAYTFQAILKQAADGNNFLHIVKALLSIGTVIGSVVINVLSYTNFKQNSRIYVSITNSVIIVIGICLVLIRAIKGNTLMVFGTFSLYLNLLGYSTRYTAQQYNSSYYQIIQMLLVSFSLLYILSMGSNKVRTAKASLNQLFALNTSKQEQDNRYVSSNKWIVFHFMLMIVCFSLNWVLHQQGQSFQRGNGHNLWEHNFQVFRVVGWATAIFIYLWTLVAARMYPQQDFDELENYFREYQLN